MSTEPDLVPWSIRDEQDTEMAIVWVAPASRVELDNPALHAHRITDPDVIEQLRIVRVAAPALG